MTTIAYKSNVIAYDSRCVSGSLILDDDDEKLIEEDGVVFVMSGSAHDIPLFVEAYLGRIALDRQLNVAGFVVDDGIVYLASMECNGIWTLEIREDCPCAVGSGESYAYAAMDLGKSAAEAVKSAMKRDVGTGGKIRTYKVKRNAII